MNWFRFIFPLLMILFPVFFTLFVRVEPASEAEREGLQDRIRTLRARLQLATAATVALYLVLWFAVSPELAYFMWMACFALWFGLTMPLLQLKNRGWQPIVHPSGQRSAQLVRRDLLPENVRGAWLGAWLVWSALAAGTLYCLFARSAPPSLEAGQPVWMLFFTLFGALWLVGGRMAARFSSSEPEPMGSPGGPELQDAYERFRRFKTWSWFGVTAVAMLAFTLPPLLLAWDSAGMLNTAILIGAGGGTLGGVLGGVVGVRADFHRAQLNRLYQDLSHGEPT